MLKLIRIMLLICLLILTESFTQTPTQRRRFRQTADSSIISRALLKRIRETRIQRPDNTINNPQPDNPQPDNPQVNDIQLKIQFNADKNPVQVGELVTLIADVNRESSRMTYIFYNENGEKISSLGNRNRCVYRFKNSGSHLVMVEVKYNIPPTLTHVVENNEITIAETLRIQVDSVNLFVNPVIVEKGKPVSYRTEFNSRESGIVFRFAFGDNIITGWGTDAFTTHSYSRSGTYNVYAEIGIASNNSLRTVTGTIIKQVRVIEPEIREEESADIFVEISSDRPEAKTGEIITFTAISNARKEGLKYLLDFGDGNVIESYQPTVQHIYADMGNYTATVRLIFNNDESNITDSTPLFINPSLREFVTLSVDKSNAAIDETITFTATTNSSRTGLEFLFFTGIKDQSVLSSNFSIPYKYASAGNYGIFVQLVVNGNVIATSQIVNLTIQESASPARWWIYLAGVLLIIGTLYSIRKLMIPPKPSFYPHIDPGFSEVPDEKEFTFNYEVVLNQNLSASTYEIEEIMIKVIQ